MLNTLTLLSDMRQTSDEASPAEISKPPTNFQPINTFGFVLRVFGIWPKTYK